MDSIFFLIYLKYLLLRIFGTDIHLGKRMSQLFLLAIGRRYVASSEGV